MERDITSPLQHFTVAFRARLSRFLRITVAAAVIAAAVALLLPNWYRASSTMLPPHRER